MINTQIAFERLGFSTSSTTKAVQQVREHLEQSVDGITNCAIDLITKMTGVSVSITDFKKEGATPDVWAITVAQAIVEYCVLQQHNIEPDLLFNHAWERANAYISKKSNQWMFSYAVEAIAQTESKVEGVAVQVEVKSDGKIKKGGKSVMTEALYKKFLDEKKARNEGPLASDNQAFIKILMDQLDMSKAGASTFAFNIRKKFAAQVNS